MQDHDDPILEKRIRDVFKNIRDMDAPLDPLFTERVVAKIKDSARSLDFGLARPSGGRLVLVRTERLHRRSHVSERRKKVATLFVMIALLLSLCYKLGPARVFQRLRQRPAETHLNPARELSSDWADINSKRSP